MIRRPPRSTQSRSSAASDVYKRQVTSEPSRRPSKRPSETLLQPKSARLDGHRWPRTALLGTEWDSLNGAEVKAMSAAEYTSHRDEIMAAMREGRYSESVSYTHLRAHET